MIAKKGRTLSDEENKRVQKVVKRLLETQTQAKLAERIGFSQAMVSSAKNGKRGGVSAWFAIAIARLAGIAPSTLIDMGDELLTPATMPEMSVQAFLKWLYDTPGIMAMVHIFGADVTIQDLFRLRESPARGGEADPAQIYSHVEQLREGPVGETVQHEVVEPEKLLGLLPPAPSGTSLPPQIKRKRRPTP